MTDPLTFIASIAPLQSAITIASDGGARVKIDIHESEMDAEEQLMGRRGRVLKITIEDYYGTPESKCAPVAYDNSQAASFQPLQRPRDVAPTAVIIQQYQTTWDTL